jgi:hypothetical protein
MVWLASPEAGFMKGEFIRANFDVDEMKGRDAEIEEGSDLRLGLLGLIPPRSGQICDGTDQETGCQRHDSVMTAKAFVNDHTSSKLCGLPYASSKLAPST